MKGIKEINLRELPLIGHAEVEEIRGGLLPHRIPRWARAQTHEPLFALVESVPAGVRLRFRTSATCLELDLDVTLIEPAPGRVLPAVFDVVVDGQPTESVSTVEGARLVLRPDRTVAIVPGPDRGTTVRMALPGNAQRVVEVWLPHAAVVAFRGARISSGADFAPVESSAPRWIHYGSSISHCLEARRPTETWPNAVALRAGLDLRNLALAGQCMLDPFVARTIRDTRASVISLKVGINPINGASFRERTFVPALHGFLDTIRDGHADVPIVLVSPVFCPSAEHAPGPTVPRADGTYGTVEQPAELTVGALTTTRIRRIVDDVVSERLDPNLHRLSGLRLFDETDADDLHDGLHPTAAGYLRIASRFHNAVFAPGGLALMP